MLDLIWNVPPIDVTLEFLQERACTPDVRVFLQVLHSHHSVRAILIEPFENARSPRDRTTPDLRKVARSMVSRRFKLPHHLVEVGMALLSFEEALLEFLHLLVE